jgi:hypothetical protein
MRRSTWIYILTDIFIVSGSFLFFIWLKPGTRTFYLPYYFIPFLFFLSLWLAVSFSIDKYRLHKRQSIRDLLFPVVAGDFIVLAAVSFLIIFFQQFQYSRMIVFGTMGLSFLAEVFLVYVYYYNRSLSRDAEHFDEYAQARIKARAGLLEPEELEKILAATPEVSVPPLNQDLVVQEAGEEVYSFIAEN